MDAGQRRSIDKEAAPLTGMGHRRSIDKEAAPLTGLGHRRSIEKEAAPLTGISKSDAALERHINNRKAMCESRDSMTFIVEESDGDGGWDQLKMREMGDGNKEEGLNRSSDGNAEKSDRKDEYSKAEKNGRASENMAYKRDNRRQLVDNYQTKEIFQSAKSDSDSVDETIWKVITLPDRQTDLQDDGGKATDSFGLETGAKDTDGKHLATDSDGKHLATDADGKHLAIKEAATDSERWRNFDVPLQMMNGR